MMLKRTFSNIRLVLFSYLAYFRHRDLQLRCNEIIIIQQRSFGIKSHPQKPLLHIWQFKLIRCPPTKCLKENEKYKSNNSWYEKLSWTSLPLNLTWVGLCSFAYLASDVIKSLLNKQQGKSCFRLAPHVNNEYLSLFLHYKAENHLLLFFFSFLFIYVCWPNYTIKHFGK